MMEMESKAELDAARKETALANHIRMAESALRHAEKVAEERQIEEWLLDDILAASELVESIARNLRVQITKPLESCQWMGKEPSDDRLEEELNWRLYNFGLYASVELQPNDDIFIRISDEPIHAEERSIMDKLLDKTIENGLHRA